MAAYWLACDRQWEALSVPQVQVLDRALSLQVGGTEVLMARAGWTAWQWLAHLFPKLERLGIICGLGNNGGDGLVLARHAFQAGVQVLLYTLGEQDKGTAATVSAWRSAQAAGVEIRYFAGELPEAEVWVDALLGIGFKGCFSGVVQAATQALNDQPVPVLALDVPTGVDANTGQAAEGAVCAEATLSFLGSKKGLLTHDAKDFVGQLWVAPLVDDQRWRSLLESDAYWYSESLSWAPACPKIKSNSHKHRRGRLLVVGGDLGMAGAALLCAEAALASGAGAVTVATRSEHVAAVMVRCPELMTCPLDEDFNESIASLQAAFLAADVVAVGPGLGQTPWAVALLKAVWGLQCPVVLDADALNVMAACASEFGQLPEVSQSWVMTPHPGEAARLLGISVTDISADRFAAIQRLYERFHCCVVLKGAGSLVRTMRHRGIVLAGNAGMAVAGMGDVLTGVVAGLLALGMKAPDATLRAVTLHASAGDLAAKQGQLGLKATDLLPHIRTLNNDF